MTVSWYMKDKAERVEDKSRFNHSNPDYTVPYLFYNGTKWKQDTAYLTQREYESLEKSGTKFGNKVWRQTKKGGETA